MCIPAIKRLLGLSLLCSVILQGGVQFARAQEVTASPFTRYGYGQPVQAISTAYKGMGGVGMALPSRTVINFANPAAYANSDSLAFIFDISGALNIARYSDGSTHKTSILGNIDYLALQFPLYKDRVVFSAGIIPFTTVGYGLVNTVEIATGSEVGASIQQQFRGVGSIQNLYAGVGVRLFKGFALGANIKYVWGDLTHAVLNIPSSSLYNRTLSSTNINLSAWTVDFGVQYTWQRRAGKSFALGATFAPAMPIKPLLQLTEDKNYGSTLKPDIVSKHERPSTTLPSKYGFGLAWQPSSKLLLASDVEIERWGSVSNIFGGDKVLLKDTYRVALGGEYQRDNYSRSYADRIKYRFGLNYKSSYAEVTGIGAIHKATAAMGIAFPVNVYNERTSYVNLSLEYEKGLASGVKHLNEDILRLSVGIAFNEGWFRKLKIY